jgi:hypothetical protein
MEYKLDFYTQYNQFYICDGRDAILKQDTTDWSTESYNSRLISRENMLIIFTESYGHIKGEIHILNKKKDIIDYSKYDHIVEGGLALKSSSLQVLNCPNSSVELKVKLEPGYYRVRIYFSNMVGYNSDEEESSDYTKIEIWPDIYMEQHVLKMYSTSNRITNN